MANVSLGVGKTYLISKDETENPKLGAKILANGKDSLYLDYYLGYKMVYNEKQDKMVPVKDRKRESLKLYITHTPRTAIERDENKETLALAKKIRFERGQQLLEQGEGYRLKKERQIDFFDYYQTYLDNYTKQDKRNIKLALHRFTDFLEATPEYKKYRSGLKPNQIDKDMILAFTEYLQSRSTGEGAHTLYQRFKKVIAYAVEHDVMRKNPCTGITIRIDNNTLKKDVLSLEEEQKLMATHYPRENEDIRRAFIFCLYTGIRFCDVKDLTFANVDYSNKLLQFEQNKTKGHSANSSVVIPLNDGLLSIVGVPTNGNKQELIFNLPSHTMCLKALRRWVKRAGINKHITWHCARHSFAVNVLNNGANIKTVASLLGHSGLKCVEKYTRAVDQLKQDAINSLPTINL